MRRPGKTDEFIPDNDGCFNITASVLVLMVGVISALGGLAWYGVSEFLERV